MATYYSQGDGNWSTLANWDTNAGGGGSDPPSADEAGMGADSFVIQANHKILMDMNMSAWTGIVACLVKSHASTPGMLYWKDGQTGILKIRSGATATNRLQGDNTSATCKGRILINYSGLWTGSTATATFMASQYGASGAVTDGGGAKRIFTPTVSPAWVVDALIGESIKINGTDYVIEDNNATTVTITTGPAIGATVTSWELVVRPLPVTYKGKIILGALSSFVTTYLDVLIHGVEPTTKYIRTYGATEVFTVVAATDVLTLATTFATILTANVPVYVSSTGTLPAGLSANTLYYVRTVSGATCKLSTTASDVGLVDITDTGVGTHFITTGIVEVSSIAANLIDVVPAALLATYWTDAKGVMFTSTDTYPDGIEPDTIYYIRDLVAANGTFKICPASGCVANTIGSTWSGTLKVMLGSDGTTLKAVAVLDDISADPLWEATGDTTTYATCTTLSAVVLVDITPAVFDSQRNAIKVKSAGVILFDTAIDGPIQPGSRMFLTSRNVAVISAATTAINVIDGTSSVGGVFACEIANTAGAVPNNYKGYGFYSTSGPIIAGSVVGFDTAINTIVGGIVSAMVFGYTCIATASAGTIISGFVAGGQNGISSSNSLVISGKLIGCYYAINSSNLIRMSGDFYGNDNAFYTCNQCLLTGNILGCNIAFASCNSMICTGNITRTYRVISSSNKVIMNNISFGYYGIYTGLDIEIRGAVSDFLYTFRDADGYIPVKVALVAPTFFARNVAYSKTRVVIEHFAGVSNNGRIYDNLGDIVKQLCDGSTAGYPDTDPNGLTSTYCIGAINLQDKISIVYPLEIISHLYPHQIWLAAGTYTITYKVFTTFATGGGIASGGLVIAASYISDDSPFTTTRLTASNAIATATNDTDWSQTIAITITTALAGWVSIDMYLTEYEANNEVFIWPVPAVT